MDITPVTAFCIPRGNKEAEADQDIVSCHSYVIGAIAIDARTADLQQGLKPLLSPPGIGKGQSQSGAAALNANRQPALEALKPTVLP